ncbi:hypothetical protein [Egicoccus sp. AB-alg2]|uniref:hypothetical protein n=1 Tax=Egicoccus sp. AB-alg2 TaxID=3242693 RepID=UPI00359E2EA8
MASRRQDVILTASLLVAIGAMTFMAFDFNEQARRIPLVVGIPTTALLAVQLLRSLLALKTGNPALADTAEAVDEQEDGLGGGRDRSGGDASEVSADEARAGTAIEAAKPSRLETSAAASMPMKASTLSAFGWVLALGVSFYLLGMLATVPVFFLAFMRLYARERWWVIAVASGVTLAVIHVFFVVLLEVRLYQGRFGELLPW